MNHCQVPKRQARLRKVNLYKTIPPFLVLFCFHLHSHSFTLLCANISCPIASYTGISNYAVIQFISMYYRLAIIQNKAHNHVFLWACVYHELGCFVCPKMCILPCVTILEDLLILALRNELTSEGRLWWIINWEYFEDRRKMVTVDLCDDKPLWMSYELNWASHKGKISPHRHRETWQLIPSGLSVMCNVTR